MNASAVPATANTRDADRTSGSLTVHASSATALTVTASHTTAG